MSRALELSLALAFFAIQCASATHWVLPYQDADDDTGEAVRAARVCIQDGQCMAMGTHTSKLGLRHGASWIRLIAYSLQSGGGLRAVQLIVLLLLMVSGAVSCLVIRRYVSPGAAPLVLLFYLQPIIATTDFTKLANSNLLPLPLALYYASVALYAEFGSTKAAVIASVCLAAAMSFNITCVLMVPLHIGCVALFARRPVAAVVMACLTLATAFTLESFDAARNLAQMIVSVPAAPTLLVPFLFGAWLLRRRLVSISGWLSRSIGQWRERLASLPVRLRLRVVMKAAVIYVSSALWTGSIVLSSVPGGQYLAPLVFPLVFLAVDSTEDLSRPVIVGLSLIGVIGLALFPFAPLAPPLGYGLLIVFSGVVAVAALASAVRRRKVLLLGGDSLAAAPSGLKVFLAVLVLVASFPDTIFIRRERQSWPVAASERLTNALYKSGYTFPQLLAAFQQQSPSTLEGVIAMLDPEFFGQPRPVVDEGWSLLALMVEPPVVTRTEGVVLTFPIHELRSAIVVRAPSYLDRTHVRTCYLADCGAEPIPEACTERQPERPVSHQPPFFEVDRMDSRAPGSSFGYQPAGGKYCTSFSSPLHTSGAHVAHIVRVSNQWPLSVRITRVSGVDFEGELPGAEVRLLDNRESTGTIEVEVSSDGLGPAAEWLSQPPLIEVTLANEHLLEPFRHRRTSRL